MEQAAVRTASPDDEVMIAEDERDGLFGLARERARTGLLEELEQLHVGELRLHLLLFCFSRLSSATLLLPTATRPQLDCVRVPPFDHSANRRLSSRFPRPLPLQPEALALTSSQSQCLV